MNQSMYAGGILQRDREEEVTLRLSFDDWLIAWVNGEKVAELRHEKGFETSRIPASLKKGKNEILIKPTIWDTALTSGSHILQWKRHSRI